jgi:hypothetical protein
LAGSAWMWVAVGPMRIDRFTACWYTGEVISPSRTVPIPPICSTASCVTWASV